MELPNDIPSVMQNISTYFMLHGAEIPLFQREKIIDLMGPGISPVDFIVRVAEALYAVSDQLDAQGREVAAQAAYLASINGWHGMTDRGNLIVNSLRKQNGEEVAEFEQPKPLDDMVAPQETNEPAPAATKDEEENQ